MQTLRLANVGMTEFSAETFAAAMDRGTFTKHLQELDLRDNRLVAFGVVSIARPIAKCLNLVMLQLDRAKVSYVSYRV